MKIAIIGSPKFDSLEYHICDELTIQKFEVKIFDYGIILSNKFDYGLSLFSDKFVEYKNKKILQKIISYKPDLVIGVYRYIHPLVVKEIKRNKIKIIHINPDQLTTLQNQQIFAEPYNAYFTKDPYMLSFMKNKMGLNTFLYQEAFSPRVHLYKGEKSFKELEEEVNIDLLCFGNLYPYRNRMLRILKERGVKIDMYGHKARFFDSFLDENYKNKPIYGEEKRKFLNGSKIVFNNFHYAEIESVNNKFFEINGSGAFQLCDYKPILNELLPIDPKRVSFTTIGEAEELIKYWLNNPEERWEVRTIINKHFIEKYSYSTLIKTIFDKI